MQLSNNVKVIILLLLSLLITNCGQNSPASPNNSSQEDDVLTIWWERGYYVQQDEEIEKLVDNWQSKTGQDVELVFIDQADLLRQVNRATQTNTLPDILYSILNNQTLSARWAWEGKLADVSDVIEPVRDLYNPDALKAAKAYNSLTQTKSLYAVPIHQQTTHIHYWKPLLTKAGLNADEIPTEWDEFWQFWQQAQDQLRTQGENDIYALGLPMSSGASDSHYLFEHILDAYDVELWDDAGNFRRDDAKMRQGIINALNFYHDLYKSGYVPPDAVDWTNTDNNTVFLNQNTLMMANVTLSIPASQREDEDVYQNQMGSLPFPQEPDGEALNSSIVFKFVVLFEESSNQEIAKDFLTYLIQPENLGNYLEKSYGRHFPIMPQLLDRPFWNDPADPHVSVATKQLRNGIISPAKSLSLVLDAVWGKAIERVVVEGISAEESAEIAIKEIEEILRQQNQ